MSGRIPSLTILSEEQKFNGENLLQWNTNITQLLGSKGLLGYINGNIPRPGPESIPLPTSETPAILTVSTPIYSSTPTFDEWNFQDQLMRGHIILDCIDVASLGVVTTRTTKMLEIPFRWNGERAWICNAPMPKTYLTRLSMLRVLRSKTILNYCEQEGQLLIT
jgi:hypothetical protein